MKVILIAGESYNMINEKLSGYIENFSSVYKYDLRENSIKDVITEANYYSLTGEEKVIVVKSANLFKEPTEEEQKILENYLKTPNDSCTIIFLSTVVPDKRKKIFKEINEKGAVELIPTLNKKELVYKCMNLLKCEKYFASYDVANFIVENSYANYDIMLLELKKIYTLINPKSLTIEDLNGVISISKTANTYAYVNAIATRNLEKAFIEIKNFEDLKIEPILVLISLAKEFELLYMINIDNPKNIQKMYHKEDWQMASLVQNKDIYTISELKKAIITLNDYDYKYKSGQIDKSMILNLIAIDFCS